jgi:cellobiose-specific phosphotransferase system component IIC
VDPLPLTLVGWLFTLLSVAALAAGALIIVAIHRAGEKERRHLAGNVLNDTLLFGIWILGLAGGIGVLRGARWGAGLLELFCWTLIVLVLLSAANRLVGLRRESETHEVNWLGAIAGLLVIVIPLVALSGATIYTLRHELVRAKLAQ